MKFAGIICEYNPIHLGHVYQMETTRRLLGADTCIVCAMSGNFVQRGDTAVFSKFVRAEAAVRSGADIVIELPTHISLDSAEGFARGGVALLNALGVCTHLSYGSECGDNALLNRTADVLLSEEFKRKLKCEISSGVSFAEARQRAVESFDKNCAVLLTKPNNILAVEYLKALRLTKSTMIPVTVSRTGGEHDGLSGLSATALRRGFYSGEIPWELMPEKAVSVFKREMAAGRGPVFQDAFEQAILYRLRTMTQEEYESLPGTNEGLGMRLKKYAFSVPGVKEIIENTKTKRYAMSRIRRMVMCALLGIDGGCMGKGPEYIRVLAAGKRGIAGLKEIKTRCTLPVITKPASAVRMECSVREAFLREANITDIYALGYLDKDAKIPGADLRTSPYMEK